MRGALLELAEQDPLINVRQDDERDEISVSLYGDVQREVIEATLERDYGVRAAFHQSTVICVERPHSVGSEEQVISAPTHTNISGRSSPDSTNPYRATLGMRIKPGAAWLRHAGRRSTSTSASFPSTSTRPWLPFAPR